MARYELLKTVNYSIRNTKNYKTIADFGGNETDAIKAHAALELQAVELEAELAPKA
jgi:hypothetical protein